MRIKVKERVCLCTDKVVGGRRSTTSDSNGLRKGEEGLSSNQFPAASVPFPDEARSEPRKRRTHLDAIMIYGIDTF